LLTPKLGTLVLIEWLDSTSLSGWQYLAPNETLSFSPRRIKTIGWVVATSPVALLLTAHTSEPGEGDPRFGSLDPLAIPRGCIMKLQAVTL